jgi:hypothetical protein
MDSTGEVKQFYEDYLFWHDYLGSSREAAIWF